MSDDFLKRTAPPAPVRPVLTEPAMVKPRGSVWTLVTATALIGGFFIGLYFLAGELGPIVLGIGLVLGTIYVIACLHYLLWGRWLSDAIRQEVEAEEQINEARHTQTRREQS
jgi:hypothetical protein